MSKPWGEKEKRRFIEQINQLFHLLPNLFTQFTLLPNYLPKSEVISEEQRAKALVSITKIKQAQSKLNCLLQLYFEQKIVPERDSVIEGNRLAAKRRAEEMNLFNELAALFGQFYAAARDFLKKEQPQKRAGDIAGEIVQAAFRMQESLEKAFGVAARGETNIIRKMSQAVRRLQAGLKKG